MQASALRSGAQYASCLTEGHASANIVNNRRKCRHLFHGDLQLRLIRAEPSRLSIRVVLLEDAQRRLDLLFGFCHVKEQVADDAVDSIPPYSAKKVLARVPMSVKGI